MHNLNLITQTTFVFHAQHHTINFFRAELIPICSEKAMFLRPVTQCFFRKFSSPFLIFDQHVFQNDLFISVALL